MARTQKIKSRWLVDFEAPRQKFTVIVEDDGNAKVTVWDKSRDASGQ
jgi:very-short-patch-repair endonuclease